MQHIARCVCLLAAVALAGAWFVLRSSEEDTRVRDELELPTRERRRPTPSKTSRVELHSASGLEPKSIAGGAPVDQLTDRIAGAQAGQLLAYFIGVPVDAQLKRLLLELPQIRAIRASQIEREGAGSNEKLRMRLELGSERAIEEMMVKGRHEVTLRAADESIKYSWTFRNMDEPNLIMIEVEARDALGQSQRLLLTMRPDGRSGQTEVVKLVWRREGGSRGAFVALPETNVVDTRPLVECFGKSVPDSSLLGLFTR